MGRASCSRAGIGAVIALIALATSPTAAPADPAPPDRVPPDPAPPDPTFGALVGRIDALAKDIARLRGLPLKRPVQREVVTSAELDARLATAAAEPRTRRQVDSENFGYARWGLIAPAADYAQLLLELRRDQVLGYYDPQARRLTLVERPVTDASAAELLLAHEIEHALVDQTFDLQRFDGLPETEGDARRARRALVEGDALATMVELVLQRRGAIAPWSDPGVTAALEKTMTIPGGGDSLDLAPLAVREAMMFPYQAGVSFVAALRRRQPWSAVDAAFKKPPRSTEQILHPERYLAGEQPITVDITPPSPLAAWPIAQATVWGELGVGLFLRTHGVDSAQAAIAADGWGGDRVLSLARPGDPRPERGIGLARFEWDSEPDAIEAAEAFEKALDNAIAGGTIEHGHTRTRWLAIDGTIAWIERKGPSLVVVLGAPAWLAAAIDPWAQSSPRAR